MRSLATFALLLLPSLSAAQTVEGMQIADGLGTVIASEEFCGLAYDQDAIAAWIDANAPADDLQFPSLLNTSVTGKAYMLSSVTGSAKTAHCAAVAKTAKAYGFMQ